MQLLDADLVEVYASLFVQCWSQYAVQQRDGSYWRVGEPLTLPHIAAHLGGQWTLGTYLLDEDDRCSFAVFDADQADGLGQLVGLATELARSGIPTLLEASRRGGHLWVHLAEPTPACVVRAWLLPYACVYGVELYPKQDRLAPGGSGSLIRLPLGIHRRSRGWYPFVEMTSWGKLVLVGETVADCCLWVCQNVERIAVPDGIGFFDGDDGIAGAEVASGQDEGGDVSLVGHGAIAAWCRAQDIVEVIGRYVALNGRGVGSCPFKEHHYRGDLRPSFQVFGGQDPHWYCYTSRRAGNLFHFLCLYYGLSPQEGWERLQQGTLIE